MNDLTKLCGQYKSLMESTIGRIQEGRRITFNRGAWVGAGLLNEDISLCLQAAFSNVYDAVGDVKQIDETILEDIVEKVYFPALDEVLDFLEERPGVTRERFAEELVAKYVNETDPRGISQRIFPLLRAYLLLEILAHNHEKKDRLTETSAYYPYKLFRKIKLSSTEIEDEIAEVLPTLYSPALLKVLPEVDKLVNRTPLSSPMWRGPYVSCGFKWTEQATKQRIEELYEPIDIRREIFDTLVQCLALVYDTALHRGRGSVKNLPHFGLTSNRYGHLKDALRVHARNQMLKAFKNSGGQKVLRNLSTRYTGLRAQIKNEELIIYEIEGKSTETLTMNSHYNLNRKYLVVCVDTLWRFYQTAERINQSKG